MLGGTAEARELAETLTGERGYTIVSSLAGRVSQPVLPPGQVRTGGFGGLAGLREWLLVNAIDVILDATHPYAATISAHAATAAHELGLPIAALARPQWTPGAGDDWHSVPTTAAAAAALPSPRARVFLTIGRQGVAHFAGVTGAWFLIRCIDPPSGPLPVHHELLRARGPFTAAAETTLLRSHRITILVTKNSGSGATAAKLAAARALHIPVIMIERPAPPAGVPHVASPAAAHAWLATLR